MYEMELNEAIRYIHDNPEVYLKPTGKTSGGYVCPICGSGSGPHKTGIQADKKEPWKFTCFAHECFPPKSDIINIIAAQEHLENSKALFRAFEIYGITLKNTADYSPRRRQKTVEKTSENHSTQEIERIKSNIKNASENLWQAEDYLRSRGISLRTADKMKCGFISDWYHPKVLEKFNGNPPFAGSPRFIFPTSEESYSARDIRPLTEIPTEEQQYIKQKAGNSKIFNVNSVATAEQAVLYVVKNEILEPYGDGSFRGDRDITNYEFALGLAKILDDTYKRNLPRGQTNPFTDVPASHWAYESVCKLASLKIVEGYGDGTFRGSRASTRYETALHASNLLSVVAPNSVSVKGEIPFSDVPKDHWAYESIAKLAYAGVEDGYSDGTFRGNRVSTRYDAAMLLAKLHSFLKKST